jgi:hypothetical protein
VTTAVTLTLPRVTVDLVMTVNGTGESVLPFMLREDGGAILREDGGYMLRDE